LSKIHSYRLLIRRFCPLGCRPFFAQVKSKEGINRL